MSRVESHVDFVVGAKDAGASDTFRRIGKEVDRLNQKASASGGSAGEGGFHGFVSALNDQFGRGSDLGKFAKLLKGGGAIFAISAIAHVFEKVTKGIEEATGKLQDGEIHATEFVGEIAKGIPIVGSIIGGIENIALTITGSKHEAEQLTKEMERWNKVAKEGYQTRKELRAREAETNRELSGRMGGPTFGPAAMAQYDYRKELASIKDEATKAQGAGVDVSQDLKNRKFLASMKLLDAQADAEDKYYAELARSYEADGKRYEENEKRKLKASEDAEDAVFQARQSLLREQGQELEAQVEDIRHAAEKATKAILDEWQKLYEPGSGANQELLHSLSQAFQSQLDAIRAGADAQIGGAIGKDYKTQDQKYQQMVREALGELASQSIPAVTHGATTRSVGLGASAQFTSSESKSFANPLVRLATEQRDEARRILKELQYQTQLLIQQATGIPAPIFPN